MTNESSRKSQRGTWLVIGLLALATVLVVISRVYRTPPPDELRETLQQPGVPGARRGMELSREGRKLLPAEEQRELDALYTEALQTLSAEDRERFLALVQKGPAANDREITESALLMQKALRALSQDKRTRLWALVEKAVQLQLAHRDSSATAERQE